MKLNHDLHLTYCTNVHRGEDWRETFRGLDQHTLAVRERIGGGKPFGIGLRLSNQAARDLADPMALHAFRTWLDANDCYIFTINGFPFGRFHGGRVKEQVFRPDWTQPERLEYTKLLFDLLVQLAPEGLEASVSTLPGSSKSFIRDQSQVAELRSNLWKCVEHISRLSDRTGRKLHLGLEPEPLGLFETSAETAPALRTGGRKSGPRAAGPGTLGRGLNRKPRRKRGTPPSAAVSGPLSALVRARHLSPQPSAPHSDPPDLWQSQPRAQAVREAFSGSTPPRFPLNSPTRLGISHRTKKAYSYEFLWLSGWGRRTCMKVPGQGFGRSTSAARECTRETGRGTFSQKVWLQDKKN